MVVRIGACRTVGHMARRRNPTWSGHSQIGRVLELLGEAPGDTETLTEFVARLGDEHDEELLLSQVAPQVRARYLAVLEQ